MKTVLATSCHPGGINSIIPVIKQLSLDKYVNVITIGYKYSEPILKRENIEYNTINKYNLDDISSKSLEKMLDIESPDLILTGTSMQNEVDKEIIEQNIILASNNKKITSISVLDFWTDYVIRFSDIYTNEKFKFMPTYIATLDEFAKKEMIEQEFSENKLIITGNPHFDNLYSISKTFTDSKKQSIRNQFELNANTIFFYAANAFKRDKVIHGYSDFDNLILINDVLNEINYNSESKCGLIVKLHPRIPSDDFEEISSFIKSSDYINLSNNHPYDLILSSDLTLTPFSTIGLESVYMNKGCISLQPNLKGKNNLEILTKNNIIPIGYSPNEVKELVKKAYLNSEYRDLITKKTYQFSNDGNATQRVSDLVYNHIF
jgi:hypothetical protein